MSARQEPQELTPLGQPPLADVEVARHLLDEAEQLPRPEIELPVETFDGRKDLLAREVRITQHARLRPAGVDELGLLEPPALLRLAVERGPRVRRRERDLERVRIDVPCEADR